MKMPIEDQAMAAAKQVARMSLRVA